MYEHVVGQYRFRAFVTIAAREIKGRKKESNVRLLALEKGAWNTVTSHIEEHSI